MGKSYRINSLGLSLNEALASLEIAQSQRTCLLFAKLWPTDVAPNINDSNFVWISNWISIEAESIQIQMNSTHIHNHLLMCHDHYTRI